MVWLEGKSYRKAPSELHPLNRWSPKHADICGWGLWKTNGLNEAMRVPLPAATAGRKHISLPSHGAQCMTLGSGSLGWQIQGGSGTHPSICLCAYDCASVCICKPGGFMGYFTQFQWHQSSHKEELCNERTSEMMTPLHSCPQTKVSTDVCSESMLAKAFI